MWVTVVGEMVNAIHGNAENLGQTELAIFSAICLPGVK